VLHLFDSHHNDHTQCRLGWLESRGARCMQGADLGASEGGWVWASGQRHILGALHPTSPPTRRPAFLDLGHGFLFPVTALCDDAPSCQHGTHDSSEMGGTAWMAPPRPPGRPAVCRLSGCRHAAFCFSPGFEDERAACWIRAVTFLCEGRPSSMGEVLDLHAAASVGVRCISPPFSTLAKPPEGCLGACYSPSPAAAGDRFGSTGPIWLLEL
jgi:hypothetical protein